ncbi:MAG: hypothetical protein H7234_06215 [Herminiimonas sp.]|nr:hypothetical protein [Herminiimonas sp.]
MNVNAPANAGLASHSGILPRPAPASAPEGAAVPPSQPIESSRPDAERLRESMTDSRNLKPRGEAEPKLAPKPGLGSAQPAVIHNISRFFALGSKETSKLQAQGVHLRENSRNRALADKLAAALKPKPFDAVGNRHFIDVIHKAEALPAALRYSVLALIPAELCKHLNYAGDNMGAVLQELLTASASDFKVKYRYFLMDKISRAFGNPLFQKHFSTAGSQVIDQLQMERTFRNFTGRLQELIIQQNGRSLAQALTQKPACPTSQSTDIDAQTICDETTACTVTPLVRGLYMVHDHEARSDLWMLLENRTVSTSPDVRKSLLTKLIPAIGCLQPETNRVMAFQKVLEAISALPSHLQSGPVEATAAYLHRITDPQDNASLFNRLVDITDAAPAEHRAFFLATYANTLATHPLDARTTLFAKILEDIVHVPVDHQAQVVEVLALGVGALPQGIERTQAYDAVLAAIKQLPKVEQARAALLLFTTIDTLPLDNTRHVKFVAAIDFVKSHPVEQRYPMLDQLQESIWCQATYETELHCLEEFLTVLQSQPPEDRQRALSVLYDTGFDIYDDSTRFAMLRTVFREVAKLPQAEQGDLIPCAAYHARDIGAPYMAFLFNDLVQCALALPPEMRGHTFDTIGQHLRHSAATLADQGGPNDQLPPLLNALLDTADVLPEAMQVALLAQIKESAMDFPHGLQADAAKAISAKVNVLAPHLIQQLIDLRAA